MNCTGKSWRSGQPGDCQQSRKLRDNQTFGTEMIFEARRPSVGMAGLGGKLGHLRGRRGRKKERKRLFDYAHYFGGEQGRPARHPSLDGQYRALANHLEVRGLGMRPRRFDRCKWESKDGGRLRVRFWARSITRARAWGHANTFEVVEHELEASTVLSNNRTDTRVIREPGESLEKWRNQSGGCLLTLDVDSVRRKRATTQLSSPRLPMVRDFFVVDLSSSLLRAKRTPVLLPTRRASWPWLFTLTWRCCLLLSVSGRRSRVGNCSQASNRCLHPRKHSPRLTRDRGG